MLIQVHPRGTMASEAVLSHIRKQLTRSLKPFSDRLTRVEVHLHDDNGPRPGRDKRVVVEARLAGCQPLVVTERSFDLYQSIRNAARTIRRTLRRKTDREARI